MMSIKYNSGVSADNTKLVVNTFGNGFYDQSWHFCTGKLAFLFDVY